MVDIDHLLDVDDLVFDNTETIHSDRRSLWNRCGSRQQEPGRSPSPLPVRALEETKIRLAWRG